jgi:hypothetical protein
MTWFSHVFEVHAVSDSEVSSPCKTPFAKDAHDLAAQCRSHPLAVGGRVDVESAAPRMTRDISEIIGESTDASLKTTSISIRVANINCLRKSRLEDLRQSALKWSDNFLVTVRSNRDVLESVKPLDAHSTPVVTDVQPSVSGVFHAEFAQQFFELGGAECRVWVGRIPRPAKSIHRTVTECATSQLSLEVCGLALTDHEHPVHLGRHQSIGEVR